MNLGQSLLDKYYSQYEFIHIAIFDNLYTAQNVMNDSLPIRELDKHYIVQVTVNKNTGYSKVEWFKKE